MSRISICWRRRFPLDKLALGVSLDGVWSISYVLEQASSESLAKSWTTYKLHSVKCSKRLNGVSIYQWFKQIRQTRYWVCLICFLQAWRLISLNLHLCIGEISGVVSVKTVTRLADGFWCFVGNLHAYSTLHIVFLWLKLYCRATMIRNKCCVKICEWVRDEVSARFMLVDLLFVGWDYTGGWMWALCMGYAWPWPVSFRITLYWCLAVFPLEAGEAGGSFLSSRFQPGVPQRVPHTSVCRGRKKLLYHPPLFGKPFGEKSVGIDLKH